MHYSACCTLQVLLCIFLAALGHQLCYMAPKSERRSCSDICSLLHISSNTPDSPIEFLLSDMCMTDSP